MEDYTNKLVHQVQMSTNYRKHTADARLETDAETACIVVKSNRENYCRRSLFNRRADIHLEDLPEGLGWSKLLWKCCCCRVDVMPGRERLRRPHASTIVGDEQSQADRLQQCILGSNLN
jgi:hypothetical protein